MIHRTKTQRLWISGERMFADVAGRTTEVIDANAREIIPAQIFVALPGASYLGRRDLTTAPARLDRRARGVPAQLDSSGSVLAPKPVAGYSRRVPLVRNEIDT